MPRRMKIVEKDQGSVLRTGREVAILSLQVTDLLDPQTIFHQRDAKVLWANGSPAV